MVDVELWQIPSREWPVKRLDVWFYRLDVSAEETRYWQTVLTPAELARGQRLATEHLRRRWWVARGKMRRILSAYLKLDARDLTFSYGRRGKPAIANPTKGSPLHFNLSHTAAWAVLLCADAPVGVDMEAAEAQQIARLQSRILAPEETAANDARVDTDRKHSAGTDMVLLWLCKEALLKGLGIGIGGTMHQIQLPVPMPVDRWFAPTRIAPDLLLQIEDDASCRFNHWIDASQWRLRIFPHGPYPTSLAIADRSPGNIHLLHESSAGWTQLLVA